MSALVTANTLPFNPSDSEHPDEAVLDDAAATQLADFFRIMADPTRVRLISALARGELCVTDLRLILKMEQSAVSHQLRALRDWRLVRARKVGRQVFYSLDLDHTPEFFITSLKNLPRR